MIILCLHGLIGVKDRYYVRVLKTRCLPYLLSMPQRTVTLSLPSQRSKLMDPELLGSVIYIKYISDMYVKK